MGQSNWIGSTIGGRYQVEALLGQGGMAGVYQATDPNLKRTVAIKLIHAHLADDPSFVRRFEEEAAAVARLRHPNIVQVFDFDHDGSLYYMVLEFVPGETLQARLKTLSATGQRLPIDETLNIMAKVCDAVGYAHQRGMIHRDLKPANVMLMQGQPILMDFGIAKIMGGTQHTATGAIVGTAAYMSPEQVQGAPLDPRSDLYSLGVMLFEMAVGHPPFEGDSAMTIMLKHIQQPVPNLRVSAGEVPERLVAVIEKALAKNPDERFQTGEAMAAALRAIQSGEAEVSDVQSRINTFLEELQSTGSVSSVQATVRPGTNRTPTGGAERDRTMLQSPGTEVQPRPSPSASASGTMVQPPPTSVMSPPKTGAQAQPEKKRGLPLGLLIALIIFGVICLVGVVGASILAATGGLGAFGGAGKSSATPTLGSSLATETATPPETEATASPSPSETPTLEPTATAVPLPTGMILIPAGTFNMGSAEGGPEEAPVHSVTLDAFLIDQYEVTNARYQKCVEAGTCKPPLAAGSFTRTNYYSNPAFADFPVIQVTWDQAATFCAWEEGKRLPTEAEWEYAARGTDGRRFPWGNDFDPSLTTVNEPDTAVVGKYPGGASPFGVSDLAGNILEWVADWYDGNYYVQSVSHNPTGPEIGTRRVLRGGSFGNPDSRFYLAARRYRQLPNFHDTDVGFRCAGTLAQ
jgi:eukaryotic-like serine/threonine-protein kinase